MIYGLDDDIDKTLSLALSLTRIIAHYSKCDNPEGGMWEVTLLLTQPTSQVYRAKLSVTEEDHHLIV